jgi:dTDP-4-dehydrorhamnose 3,5-epimerase
VKFNPTSLPGVFIIEQEPVSDERGAFARFFCADEYREHGLDVRIAQCSVSKNARRGTLRGLHYQDAPRAESKTVRCLKGAAFDVIADLRPESPTRYGWFGVELRADSGTAVYAPAGCAHGFLTLEDDTWLEYLISEAYVASLARGVRYDDPRLSIGWPFPPTVISTRDRGLPAATDI